MTDEAGRHSSGRAKSVRAEVRKFHSVLVCLLLLTCSAASAQVIDQKYENKIQAARTVSALTGSVFGEAVSDYNGATAFTHVDISIPGNSPLPVSLGRTLSVEDKYGTNSLAGFGDWDVDVPYIMGIFASTPGWTVAGPTSPDRFNRCSSATAPYIGNANFTVDEVWGGHQLHIPGGENGQLIKALYTDSYPEPTDGNVYPWITGSQSRLRCLAATKNGYAGEAFALVTTSGLTYYFDWGVEVAIRGIGKHSSRTIGRKKVYLLASRIEDRFGNWVNYGYSGSKLTSITSNDGRQITLSYTGNTITSAVSDAGSWTYQYDGSGKLSAVILPDSSRWSFGYTGNLATAPPPSLPPLDDSEPTCDEAEAPENTFEYRITHPAGATGTFDFQQRRFYRTRVPRACNNTPAPASYDWLTIQNYFDTYALGSLTVSGPGIPAQVTSYHYGWSNPLGFCTWAGTACQELCLPAQGCTHVEGRWVTITRPDGTKTKRLMGVQYGINEGRLLREQVLDASGALQRETVNTYVADSETSLVPFSGVIGQRLVRDPMIDKMRPLRTRTITQQGVDFSWQVGTCSGQYCFDGMANPTSVTKSSTLPGSPSKVVQTQYEHNTTYWVLGQVKKTTEGGIVASETTYNLMGMPEVMKSFGKVKQTLGYNADGTVATVKDGNNNVITLSSWYRGIPRSIAYPDSTTQSATVSAAGWVTSVTDQNGYVTGYGYDAMGRLASVVYPTSDTTAWNTTTQVFQQIAGAEYGIPAGHWRQTVSTGNARKITYFDGLWRPLLTKELDATNATTETLTKRFQRFTYDHAGRTTFVSYPGTTDALSTGTWTEYDALGRATSLGQDSELGVLTTLTAYQTGFKTRVTSPKGLQTTTSFLAWDSPTTELPVQIVQPAGAVTDIVRETIFGKPTALTRRNTGGTVSLTRSYLYNVYQELCRSVEPETGATLMGYDNAGNLTWSAGGLPAATGCHDTGLIPAIQPSRVARAYNNRNLLTSLSFPDGVGNQGWTYTPDGLPDVVTTYNSTGGSTVTNAYSYNKRRMLVGEAMTRGTGTPWSIGYGYDGNGSASTLVYPSGLTISFAPNALGQPTQAGSYATGVQYYPNGAIKQFSYGNGIVHTMTQNARQLPSRSTDCTLSGACATANRRLDLAYGYDEHGNVGQITDHVNGRQTRGMAYDDLDRLTQTTSAMFGTASYTYDVLDNLLTTNVTAGSNSRNHTYVYEASSNRLTQIKQTVGGAVVANLGYDVRGNLASKGTQTYQFDYGNRLRNVPGKETGYQYDALGRRVYSSTTGSSYIVSQYSQGGVLLYQQDFKRAKGLEYVYLGGSLVAFRETPHGTSTSVVKYQHTDALGTPIAVTDAAKAIIETSEYEPYGQLVNRALTDGPGFTGHVQDAATGLTYMQQRYYDPTVGRFLSVDPVTALSSPVGMFNRYKYAANNPYRFVDPDGRKDKEVQQRERTDFRSMSSRPGLGGSATEGHIRGMTGVSYSSVRAGGGSVENKFYMNDEGEVLGKTQQGCYGDDRCTVTRDELPEGTTLVGHVHVYPVVPGSRNVPERLIRTREFPGPGDGAPLRLGVVSGVMMPSGARYIIDGDPSNPKITYLGGGDAKFGKYVQDNWKSGMSDKSIQKLARDYK